MIGGIGNAIKEAQEVLDKGGQLGGRYSGNRNPTETELKSWRTVLSVAEDQVAVSEAGLGDANAILGRWDKATAAERAVMADLIWTLTCSLRIGSGDAPSTAKSTTPRTRARKAKRV